MTNTEIEQYCNEMRELFLTPGWKWLVADCTDAINSLNTIAVLKDAEQLYKAQGAMTMAQRIIDLPDSIEALEAQLEEQAEDEDADAE